MHEKNLPISTEDFPTVINGGYYFVDKSMFIAEALSNMSESKLILRPRRFGKSLNISMLKAFLEIGSPKELFEGLAISVHKDLCEAHQAQHPVIFLSLKDIDASDFPEALDALSLIISEEADRLEIGFGNELKDAENASFHRMSEMKANRNDVKRSIRLISKALHRRHGKKAIVLIDEYDAPINQAYQKGYYDEMAILFRGLLGQALKGNPFVEFAVLTGILRVSKESIFSGLNNIAVYSALDDEFSSHFGFTGEEVAAMVGYYGLEGRMADMKEYYNGYKIGSFEMYNPWSVVRACSRMVRNESAAPEMYWANTASNDLVRDMLGRDGFGALALIEDLANGGTINKRVSILSTYRDLADIPGSEAVWDMMFMAGYLTWVGKANNGMYELRAPNLEIREALRKDALSWAMSAMPITEGKADELFSALLAENAREAEAAINDLFENVLSVRDGVAVHGSFKASQERHCHLIVAALLSCSSWSVKSEAESGDGYIDLLCTNVVANAAIVIEEKFSATDDDEQLAVKAQEAIGQIAKKKYAKSIEGFDTVIAVGIAYASRRCRIAINTLK
ncbi:MAG: ATP-binding protein [Eubacteriaceae bacterium]|nr:ATP-binding protein [Eubacteriaceae bacterium]